MKITNSEKTLSAVRKNIKKYNMIDTGDVLVLGVSGGYDSIMLLDIMYKLKKDFKYEIVVAHVNHGVRGKESDQDEKFVENRAKKYGIEFFSKKVDMNGYAKEKGISPEEAGRILRYSFFREILRKYLHGKIVVAHNKNDQSETVLMRIMRGTGIDGLRGIEYVNNEIIRPILNISRKEIEDYCIDNKLDPKMDSTNLETIYARNKVRLELIPYIEENFNENIIDTLFRFSNIMVRDSEYLNKVTLEEYIKIIIKKSDNKVTINNGQLISLDEAIKTRVIRRIIGDILGNTIGIEERHIRDILKFSKEGNTGKYLNLPNNLLVKINYNKLSIEKSGINVKVRYNYMITTNDIFNIPETGDTLELTVIDRDEVDFNKDSNIEYFDLDKIKGDISVRNRRDGDRIKLFGSGGTKKLKNYFIDEKIERDEREILPILLFDDEIAWIIGRKRGNIASLSDSTKKVLVVKYINKNENFN